MSGEFFDKDALKKDQKQPKITVDPKKLEFHIKETAGMYYLYFEINSQRLNATEIRSLLSEYSDVFNEDEKHLLHYVSHRLGMIQTMYKLFGDVEMILDHLHGVEKPIYVNEYKVNYLRESQKLNLKLYFDDQSNIILDVLDEGEFLFGIEKVFFLTQTSIATLPQELPLSFYKQLSQGKNKFSIDVYLSLKDDLIEQVKAIHNVDISDEIVSLDNLEQEKITAPAVIEIGKTTHFITIDFKYEVGGELFPVGNYQYAETINWQEIPREIKTVKEGSQLYSYESNLELNQDVSREIFEGTRIRPSFSSKSPFSIMLQISYLEPFIKSVMPKIEEKYKVYFKDGQRLRLADGQVKFELETDLKKRLDLFEFKVKFRIEDEYFDLDFLKDLMQKNKKFVQLQDGTTVNIENIREINKWIEFLSKYDFRKSQNAYKASSQAALELDEFLRDFGDKNVVSNEEYRNLIQEMKEKKPIEELPIPENVEPVLRGYQKEGIYWMHFLKKYGFGGILSDEMGLGKTLQALTVLKMNQSGIHLVVCPKTLIYNWESEVKKFFPEMRVLIVDGSSQKRERLIKEFSPQDYDLVITSYSMLQKDYVTYMDRKIEFDYKILDEAHYVKNMKTLSAKAARLIPGKNRILLTGTPLENNLEELYGTFDLIMPGYLGSKLEFRRDFVSKIERNNMIALEILQSKIRPFILRRTKKEVLDELPEKQEQIVYNEMTNKQVAIYNEVLQRVKNETMEVIEQKGMDRSHMEVLSALLKLRQVCNHPQLLDKSFIGEESISGKYEQFLELLEEVIESGEKVLVFSQFTSMLDIFEKELIDKKVTYLRLDGSTKNRQEVVDQFNDDESVSVFLISLKAGGVGLNLTAASSVFLYDPWWNPMVEQQAIDRAHRIGQKKTVNIYKFITRNSIEEKILGLQERKGNMFENLVIEDNNFIKRLEWQDLMELFE